MTIDQARDMIANMTEAEKRSYAQALIKENQTLLDNTRFTQQKFANTRLYK